MFNLQPLRHISTLPKATELQRHRELTRRRMRAGVFDAVVLLFKHVESAAIRPRHESDAGKSRDDPAGRYDFLQ